MFKIIEVNSKKQLKQFVNFSWEIYKNDKNWVAPLKMAVLDLLDEQSNPFYQTAKIKNFLLVNSKDKIIGRISAIYNTAYNKFHNVNIGFIGFFECINNQKAADLLFNHSINYLQQNFKITQIQGPMNPSTNYECGLLVNGYDDPAQIMMTYNPQYYQILFKEYGFDKEKDLLAFNLDLKKELPEVIYKVAKRSQKSNAITYRTIDKKNWDSEVATMNDIYNMAWEKNWGFVPMTEEEFKLTAKDLKMIVDPKLIIFIEVNGDPAGFVVTLPDLNQALKYNPSGKLLPFGIFKLLFHKKYVNRSRVITLGIKQKYRNLGLGPLLYLKSYQTLNELGYNYTEMSWVLEDNKDMIKPIERMGGEVYKTYRIFKKDLKQDL